MISVHAPLTDDTRHLFDAAAFAAIRPGVVFVNAARGGLVDQDALLAALDAGQVGAAALDVTDPEPLPTDHPLLHRDDVLVTPHVASATDAGKLRLYQHASTTPSPCSTGARRRTSSTPRSWSGVGEPDGSASG